MRHTRAHTRNRRSHHAITQGSVSVCPECGASKTAHRACNACGVYRGRKVVGKKTAEVAVATDGKKSDVKTQKKDSQTKKSK